MPSTNDVNALVNAADTAVRTACVLDLLANSRPLPPFADEAVKGAIAMLDDALGGSALLRGRSDTKGFSGSLNAYCWATDSYIAGQPNTPTRPDLGVVEELLKQIQQQMSLVPAKIKDQSRNGVPDVSFDVARNFFDALAKMLARRATASLTRPTRAQVAVGTL